MSDLERARSLGMTIEEFQALVGMDPLDSYPELTHGAVYGPDDKKNKKNKKKNKKEEKKADNAALRYNMLGIGDGVTLPFETDEDVRNKDARELENYWDRPVVTPEDEQLYFGYHIHSKDNVYGLHAHYPGGPLGGGHLHGAQNKNGYHTHRFNVEQLAQFKFARPGIMITLDGPHAHQYNAPDGKHVHAEENFGPASGDRVAELMEREERADTQPTPEKHDNSQRGRQDLFES
jgi:hypothetical protein